MEPEPRESVNGQRLGVGVGPKSEPSPGEPSVATDVRHGERSPNAIGEDQPSEPSSVIEEPPKASEPIEEKSRARSRIALIMLALGVRSNLFFCDLL